MNRAQEQNERLVGEHFIGWYNQVHGTKYRYAGRPDSAPDLLYRDGRATLTLEITEAFYDTADAKFKWKNRRGEPDAPRAWAGVEPDGALGIQIGLQIAKKAANAYGSGCVLVVDIDPTVSNPADLERALPKVPLPLKHSFRGVYVGGFFGFSSGNESSGYRCWKLFEA